MKIDAKQRLRATAREATDAENKYVEELKKGSPKADDFKEDYVRKAQEASLRHPEAQRKGKNQDWFYKLEEKAKQQYVKKHPATKFKAGPNIHASTSYFMAIPYDNPRSGWSKGGLIQLVKDGKIRAADTYTLFKTPAVHKEFDDNVIIELHNVDDIVQPREDHFMLTADILPKHIKSIKLLGVAIQGVGSVKEFCDKHNIELKGGPFDTAEGFVELFGFGSWLFAEGKAKQINGWTHNSAVQAREPYARKGIPSAVLYPGGAYFGAILGTSNPTESAAAIAMAKKHGVAIR